MANVHLQRDHTRFTGGDQVLQVDGGTVGKLIDELDRRYPGLGKVLREGSSVAINSEIIANGMYERLDADTEVHFIAIIAGG
jgi:molybdopterin converting factor small subunit